MTAFRITYNKWNPKEQKLREALCTLGNGYFGSRGAAEENSNNEINNPGTYLAGGYNRAKTEISGRIIENEDLVNFPNWLCLSFRPEGGKWLNLEEVQILNYQQNLEMKNGTLERIFRIKDEKGRITSIYSCRFVSMDDMHRAAIQWHLIPENWDGKIEICTALDGTVVNDNVARYKDLENHHLKPLSTKVVDNNSMLLLVETKQSKITMAQAARTRVYCGQEIVESINKSYQEKGYIEQIFNFSVEEGKKYIIEKIVAVYTNKDKAITEPSLEACKDINRAGSFKKLLSKQKEAYQLLWHRCDIGIIGSKKIQKLTRLHIFHNLQTLSPNTIGLDIGVPSRGWHGEAYRGHVFWDELFIYPFMSMRFPEITRSLLMYRYYRLNEARYAAKLEGYRGAMFPWQSGSNGKEETQILHLNPKSGNWLPDYTHLQRHVNSAIAYNIWNYYISADDKLFLSHFGAEIFISIALFWASKAQYNIERDRYEIHGVVGPDEYHTSYPYSDEQGLKNNAYTNVMAAWVLQKAVEILDIIEKSRRRELSRSLGINEMEISLWQEISKKMFIPFNKEGIINQFEGYEKLREFPWEDYRQEYDDIQRLDRILENEGDTPNKYKASKQADVLMLFYLFTLEELKDILGNLGYIINEEIITKNIKYYRDRTTHGSTLSRLVFSWIHSKYDKKLSWENFEALIISDFEDIQGGTTSEGIHLGAMAGSLDLIQRNFAGFSVCDDALWFNPQIPESILKISMRINYRKHWIFISVDHQKLKISFEEGWSNKVKIGVNNTIYEFKQGEVREFHLASKSENLKE